MHERYGVWKDSINCLFGVDADKKVRDEGFTSSIESHLFGSLMLMNVKSREQNWGRAYSQIAGNGMDHYGVGIFTKGSLACETGKGGTELRRKGLVVYDLTQPFTAQTSDLESISLTIPRALVEELLHQPDDHCMRFLDPDDPMVRILYDQLTSIYQNVRSLSHQQSLAIGKTLALMISNCLNTASGPTRETTHQRSGIMNMVRMRRYFRENLGSPDLNPRQAAHDLGVSRSKLYNYFAPYGGVYNYIRDMRLRQAISLLNDPLRARSSIYDLALECGFSSDASFIRAFREKYDTTPGEVRNGAVVSERQTTNTNDLVDKRYESWLYGLT
ncbi:helix-turn-helix domain-containing protein [Thalassospira lucentensis]|nr:helix-turn-helix domain-containing protein [Thalassospira lucentensis]